MLKPGDKVDRYSLESVLGEGGMGSVFRAHDERLDRHVALKVVRAKDDADEAAHAEATARLVREARAAAKLSHPNAVSVFDVGEALGHAFIAMELVPGRTLRAVLADRPQVAAAQRVRWLVDVARALSAAHRAGIVHRDVKPENVMVSPDGVVKVLDFGIARRTARDVDPSAPTESNTLGTLTGVGVNVGTPLYMAPEQIRGDAVDGRTDQFAWGALAFEVLAGRSPWEHKGDALALAAAILTQPMPPLRAACPDATETVEAVVAKALSKHAGDRFASMDELLMALSPDAPVSDPPAVLTPSLVTPPTARTLSKPPLPQPSPPTPSTPPRRSPIDFARYSAETVRAIVGRALERQAAEPEPGFAADEVLAAARDVGVDEETLRAAARDVVERKSRERDAREERERAKRKLLRNGAMFLVVNVFLLVIVGWSTVKWSLLGWGFFLALNVVRYTFPDEEKDEKKRQKLRKKQGRVDVVSAPPPVLSDAAVDDAELARAVDALLLSSAARHDRIRVAEPGKRVAEGPLHDTAMREAEAEIEADLAADQRERARR